MIGLARLSDGPSRLGSIVLCGDLLHKEVGMGGKTQALAMDLHEEGLTLLGLKAETVPIAGGKEAPHELARRAQLHGLLAIGLLHRPLLRTNREGEGKRDRRSPTA